MTHILLVLWSLSSALRASGDDRPHLRVWTNREDPYHKGEAARVYLTTDRDAFVTVLRVDTDGRLRILFPAEPWADNRSRAGHNLEVVEGRGEAAFTVADDPGVGYVFAVASAEPFNYDPFTTGDRWDYREAGNGWIRGDPYVVLTDFAARIAGGSHYDYDVTPYYVERVYDYPRFVCYDCHSYLSYSAWDPYASFCSRFRLVVYDDPFYYPYRHYGTNVVMERPLRPGPRFVFKDPADLVTPVTRVAARPRNVLEAARAGPDRSSADFGGPGRVPAPVAPRNQPAGVRPGPGMGLPEARPADPPAARPAVPSVPDPHGGKQKSPKPPSKPGQPPVRPPEEKPHPASHPLL